MYVLSPDAPLRFAVPPGWPAPTPDWVREHQGMHMPLGWMPPGTVAPTPAGWVFWSRNRPVWDALVAPAIAPFRRRTWWGVGIFLFGLLATAIGAASASPGGVYFLFWGALIFGPIQAIRAGVGWSRANAGAMVFIQAASADLKRQADWAAYQQYIAHRERGR